MPRCLGGNCTSNQDVESLNYVFAIAMVLRNTVPFLLTEAGEITEASKGHIEVTENLGEFTYWSLNIFFRRQ